MLVFRVAAGCKIFSLRVLQMREVGILSLKLQKKKIEE
jgi:hypothetical protein